MRPARLLFWLLSAAFAGALAGALAGAAVRLFCGPSSGWEYRAFGGTWVFDFFSRFP